MLRIFSAPQGQKNNHRCTTTTYTYNALDQLTQSDDGSTITTYAYDLHGNLEQITQGTDITTYDYNGLERLESVTLPDTTTIDYTYDADGRRLSQTVNSTDTTTYLWDEFSTYGDVVQTSTTAGDTTYTTGLGLVLAQSTSTEDQYLYHDGQGSTRALADASGNIVQEYTYTAFGELYNPPATLLTDYLYAGQQYDELTGLYNLRARQYDPALGRFLGRDTYSINYQNPVELNRYVYTANNPVNRYDPSGYNFIETALNYLDKAAETVALKAYRGGICGLIGGVITCLMARNGACGSELQAQCQGPNFWKTVLLSGATGYVYGGLTGLLPAPWAAGTNTFTGTLGLAYFIADADARGINPCNALGMLASGVSMFGSAFELGGYLSDMMKPPGSTPLAVGVGVGGNTTGGAGAGSVAATGVGAKWVGGEAFGGTVLAAETGNRDDEFDESLPGASGPEYASETHWKRGSARLDSENPAPGKRAGQIHVQDTRGKYKGIKWQWDFEERHFDQIPRDVERIIRADYQGFRNALNHALRYLGEREVRVD